MCRFSIGVELLDRSRPPVARMALREVNHRSGTAGGGRTSCHGARGRLRCILAQHRAQAVGLGCVDRECLRQQLRVEFFGRWGDGGLGVAGVSVAADEVVDAELPCLVADPVEDDPGDGEWDGRGGGHR